MKKITLSAITACIAVLVGCKSVPSANALYSTTYAIGVSAALVMDQTKISDSDRNVIIDIVNDIDIAVPQTNSTFKTAWTQIAETHVGALVAEGKLTTDQAKLILSSFNVAVDTVDYLVYKRYPTVALNVELVSAATHGFCNGFLTFYKPTNTLSVGSDYVYDQEAYDRMMKKIK